MRESRRGASKCCGNAGGKSTACRQPPEIRKKTSNKFWVVCRTSRTSAQTSRHHTVEKRGHILVLSPKFHPEVAGVGIEYSWGMSKLKFRRGINDEVPKNLHRNILASVCRETILTLSRIRRFARRTRDYCRAYLRLEKDAGGPESRDSIEKVRKTCKAHHNIIDMEPSVIDTQ